MFRVILMYLISGNSPEIVLDISEMFSESTMVEIFQHHNVEKLELLKEKYDIDTFIFIFQNIYFG